MGNRYILQRLIEWVNKLSDSELRELSYLFSQRDVIARLTAIIDDTLVLRHAEGEHKSQPEVRAKVSTPTIRKRQVSRVVGGDAMPSVAPSRELKQAFFDVFEDTRLFPSRRDMLNAMDKVFNCGFEYSQHEKRGRKDLITKCWNMLKELPKNEQRQKLMSLINRISQERAYKDDYKELFRLLVNHE